MRRRDTGLIDIKIEKNISVIMIKLHLFKINNYVAKRIIT